MKIRTSDHRDKDAIHALFRAAFPTEDLSALVNALLVEPKVVLSASAAAHGTIVGQVFFTAATFADGAPAGALLGPLAVAPAHQRMGIGRQLVEYAAGKLAIGGVARLFVLGDPAYYARLGFRPEVDVRPPYALPREWDGAWQSLTLSAAPQRAAGPLVLPACWMDPALWGP